jgi:hypothetical protein
MTNMYLERHLNHDAQMEHQVALVITAVIERWMDWDRDDHPVTRRPDTERKLRLTVSPGLCRVER